MTTLLYSTFVKKSIIDIKMCSKRLFRENQRTAGNDIENVKSF